MKPTIADITLHRLVQMLPGPGARAAAWPGGRGAAAPRCSLHAGDAHVPVHVERVSVTGAQLVAPTAGLVGLSDPERPEDADALVLRVRHPRLPGELLLPCVLVGAAPRGAEHALSVRFCPSPGVAAGLQAALQAAFDQRSGARTPVREDVVPVVLHEAWRARTLRGVVQDLSATGVGIVLDLGAQEPPSLGEPVRLRFRLPGQADAITVHAEVRSVRPRPIEAEGHGGLVEVGLSLTEAHAGDREVADRIAAQLGPAD
jgi:hypothetical protein